LMRLLGAPEMASDPKYQTNEARVSNRATLIARMAALTAKFTRTDLLHKLEEIGVPGGPINSVADVFDDPQVLAREMRLDLPSPMAKSGLIPGVRTPITLNGRRAADKRPSPQLGEHTEEILRELGES
jgi:crotonobetainyl-CoA:carnitine CoA-transferase CaiB-like acyl-CoA transferase